MSTKQKQLQQSRDFLQFLVTSVLDAENAHNLDACDWFIFAYMAGTKGFFASLQEDTSKVEKLVHILEHFDTYLTMHEHDALFYFLGAGCAGQSKKAYILSHK